MDSIDYKILQALQQNGRLSNVELAQQVHLSPSPCLRRVRKLEENGIIQGYTAVIDPTLYGLPVTVFVSIRLEKQDTQTIADFEAEIEQLDAVVACYLMAGSHDYLLMVVAQGIQEYEAFVRQHLNGIKGIAAIESRFAFGQVKMNKQLPALAPQSGANDAHQANRKS